VPDLGSVIVEMQILPSLAAKTATASEVLATLQDLLQSPTGALYDGGVSRLVCGHRMGPAPPGA
jgi:hypothetical protein